MDISDNDIDNNDFYLLNNNCEDLNLIFNNLSLFNKTSFDFDNNYSFYPGSNPSQYKSNFNHCYACNKYMIISKNELPEFFKDNLEKKVNKKNLILMYRLFDECKFYIDFKSLIKFDKIISDIVPANNIVNSSEWRMTYETYFNQQGLNFIDYVKCSNCHYNFCPRHCQIAKFKHFKCISCNKFFDICNWCKSNYTDNLCFFCHY